MGAGNCPKSARRSIFGQVSPLPAGGGEKGCERRRPAGKAAGGGRYQIGQILSRCVQTLEMFFTDVGPREGGRTLWGGQSDSSPIEMPRAA